MTRKVFTDEEIEMLRQNPHTRSVTPKTIKFTQEFKDLFWQEYQNGVTPSQIFEKYSYPKEVLGGKRIKGISRMIREKMKEDGDYYCSEEEFRKLKKEVEHANAEVEFLKKLLPLEVNGGSRCFNIKGYLLKRPLRAKQPFLFHRSSADFSSSMLEYFGAEGSEDIFLPSLIAVAVVLL